jgi:hypothetical protein
VPILAPTASANLEEGLTRSTAGALPNWLVGVVKGPLLFCLLVVACVGIQHWVGAYETERGNYSDEASHVLNGLLVRDYLHDAFGQDPVGFAQDYYINYPKIAPAVWPPLFHVVLGLLLLLRQAPQLTALLLVGTAGGWTAWRLWTIVDRLSGPAVAFVATIAFLATPAFIDMTSVVMLDVVVAAVMLEATFWLIRYFATGRLRDAVVFGVLAALCCLTKGNGIAIVLVAPLLAALARRPGVLVRPGLWVAAAIVVVFALPAVVFSFRFDAAIGDFGAVTGAIAGDRLVFYLAHMATQLGAAVMALGLVGIALVAFRTVTPPLDSERLWVNGLGALIIAAFAFHVFNPHQVIDPRYILMAMAPMMALAAYGSTQLVARLGLSEGGSITSAVVVVVVACGLAAENRPPPVTRHALGWRAAVRDVWKNDSLRGHRILVVSDERGEGAFVSEVALEEPSPRATVIRGSKLLATDDWNGRQFRLTFTSPAAVTQELEDLHVSYLVLDGSPAARALPYYPIVAAAANGDRAELVYSADSDRPIKVYRLKNATPGPAKKLRVMISGQLTALTEHEGRSVR